MALQEITQEEDDNRLFSPSTAGDVFPYDEGNADEGDDDEEDDYEEDDDEGDDDEEDYGEGDDNPADVYSLRDYDPADVFSDAVPYWLARYSPFWISWRSLLSSPQTSEPVHFRDADDREDNSYQQQEVNQRDGLSKEIISEFVRSRTCQDEDVLDICVVCQCEYEREEMLGTLECGHEYHESCIHRWLLVKNSCPLCQRKAILHHQQ